MGRGQLTDSECTGPPGRGVRREPGHGELVRDRVTACSSFPLGNCVVHKPYTRPSGTLHKQAVCTRSAGTSRCSAFPRPIRSWCARLASRRIFVLIEFRSPLSAPLHPETHDHARRVFVIYKTGPVFQCRQIPTSPQLHSTRTLSQSPIICRNEGAHRWGR